MTQFAVTDTFNTEWEILYISIFRLIMFQTHSNVKLPGIIVTSYWWTNSRKTVISPKRSEIEILLNFRISWENRDCSAYRDAASLKIFGNFLKKIPWSKDLLQIICNRGQPKDSSLIRIIRIWVLNLTTPSELPEFYTWLTTFRTTKMIFNSCRTLFTDTN